MRFLCTRTSIGGSSTEKPHEKAIRLAEPYQKEWVKRYWAIEISSLEELISMLPTDKPGDIQGFLISNNPDTGLSLEIYDDWRE